MGNTFLARSPLPSGSLRMQLTTQTRAAHLRDLLENETVMLPFTEFQSKESCDGPDADRGCLYRLSCTLLPAVHEALEFLVR